MLVILSRLFHLGFQLVLLWLTIPAFRLIFGGTAAQKKVGCADGESASRKPLLAVQGLRWFKVAFVGLDNMDHAKVFDTKCVPFLLREFSLACQRFC